jgi:hypothetical protein
MLIALIRLGRVHRLGNTSNTYEIVVGKPECDITREIWTYIGG